MYMYVDNLVYVCIYLYDRLTYSQVTATNPNTSITGNRTKTFTSTTSSKVKIRPGLSDKFRVLRCISISHRIVHLTYSLNHWMSCHRDHMVCFAEHVSQYTMNPITRISFTLSKRYKCTVDNY